MSICPKNKSSKSRRDKRRANWKMSAPNLVKCSKCGALMMPHRVCKSCGSYNKKEILANAEQARFVEPMDANISMKIGILAFFAIGGKCHRNTKSPLISIVLALIFIANLTLPWMQTKVLVQKIQTLRIGENIACQDNHRPCGLQQKYEIHQCEGGGEEFLHRLCLCQKWVCEENPG